MCKTLRINSICRLQNMIEEALAISINLSQHMTIQLSLLPSTSIGIKCLSRERYRGKAVESKADDRHNSLMLSASTWPLCCCDMTT